LGGRAAADFRGTDFFAFAPALLRRADFVDFFGAAFAAPLFRLTTVFFAISRLVISVERLEVPGTRVEIGGQLFVVEYPWTACDRGLFDLDEDRQLKSGDLRRKRSASLCSVTIHKP
jgi:hypothetical protein